MNIRKTMQAAIECLRSGNIDQAERTCEEILSLQPSNVSALHFLGVAYYRNKKYEPAIMCMKRVLHLQPDYADAHNNLGLILKDMGQLYEATSCFRTAVALKPLFFEAYINLGGILHSQGALDEAIACFQKAVQLNPLFYGTYNDLGIMLKDRMQFDKAVFCFRKALELNPRFLESYVNLGNALQAQGLVGEAIAYFQKAVQLCPDSSYANYNLALALLQSGNFREGWEKYEWRRGIEGLSYLRTHFYQPLWNGSDMRGGTLLLLGEQGFGDIIQFIRYVPFVIQRNAKPILCCHKELKTLMQNIDGIQDLVTYGDQLPAFDAYCPLLSLPFIFRSVIETIPANIPYIRVDPSLSRQWQDKIQSGPLNLKVGLVWSGNPDNVSLLYKSCLLQTFSPLAELDDVTFYSLQKGAAAIQAKNPPHGMKLTDYSEKINDFADTAALIQHLDLVISVDTAVAHLAGALGKIVWTLLPYPPDWRWMLDREDSPWYPSMRLFRQSSPGDWEPVIARIRNELEKLLSFARQAVTKNRMAINQG
jgi:Flp pilus assembly protein TadD